MAVVKTLIGNVKGPKGDPGEQGTPGAQGIQGADGIRGSRIVSGNAITGTSTSPASYATGIADSLVNDHYINTYNGNIYRCTKSGDANTAQWVFVGNLTSSNTFDVELGHIWTEFNTTIKDVRDIAYDEYAPIVLAAVGRNPDNTDNGNVSYSNNGGNSWHDGMSDVDTALNSVAYCPNHSYFYAVGENCTILRSFDGSSWELVIEGHMDSKPAEYAAYPDTLRSVIWNEILQKVVIVGGEGRPGVDGYNTEYVPLILLSDDGRTWERYTTLVDTQSESSYLSTIAYDNTSGVMVAGSYGGDLITSTDGQVWSPCQILGDISSITSIKFGRDGIYRGVTLDGSTFYSNANDPSQWSTNSTNNSLLYDIEKIEDLNIWIAVGKGTDGNISYSSDGKMGWEDTWENLSANDDSSDYTGSLLCASHIPTVGTFIGRSDGKILKLTTDTKAMGVTEAVEEMYNKNINSDIIRKTLKQGETKISIADSRIKEDSILSFYTSIYGVNPNTVIVSDSSVTLTFDAQENNMEVGVSIDG